MSVCIPNPVIRVMLRGRYKYGGDRQWCVAAGDVPKPKRRCEWRAVAFYASHEVARRAVGELDPYAGRAIFDLSNDRLQFISPSGELLRCPRAEARLLS